MSDILNRNQLGTVGAFGEDAAAEYVKDHGYNVIARNVKYGRLELDMIAENSRYLVFFEVKTRTVCTDPGTARYGPPSSAIDGRKKKNIISAAKQYLKENRHFKLPRIDVIEVYVRGLGDHYTVDRINHFEGAIQSR